ncbi:sigma 54-interacting transcriptional regulator [Neptuniibacter sp. CAU 1671]|uniref:sigma-54 interaction domain-containing protein n=1 Tax=Neptuniibacter sp. CAU 1671 TaxID=3032593 RepID=UPI0023DA8604|nr:sigma 54-interacting transcriptional regulator [Neptuniibacter sp. CAU 1671]MDF2181332.1 sigma 54-interacting transcriptional regulator [Neptuniibacter sp. CAU 1671]
MNSLANLPKQNELFDLLTQLCQVSIAVDENSNITWLSPAYRTLIGLDIDTDYTGKHVEEVLPNSQLPRVVQSGKPSFVDLMQINDLWCVVTRLPIRNQDQQIIGAVGFVFYDDIDDLQPLFDKFALLRQRLEQDNILRSSRYALEDMIGQSAAIKQIKRQALRAAQLDTTLLLLGETGTGKELLAQAIHHASPRHHGPFVGINMAALPESLAEAELFGTAPGAYTGADKKGRKGKIQLAHGGTLFLDEIADMPLAMQAKLLRVLQEREVEALGSNRLEKVDVRVIAATSTDLKQMVDNNQFRADLYYRLNVLPIQLPPLRERKEDIPELSQHILEKIQQATQLPVIALSAPAIEWLQQYHWPGNIRELYNRLERGCVLAEGKTIEPADLGALDDLPDAGPQPDDSLRTTRQQAECRALHSAIRRCHGNKTEAAELLGISRATLYLRLKSCRPSRLEK